MSIPPEIVDTVTKLALAMALGGLLGLERERKHRAAGLRTHVVVCFASTVAIILANRMAEEWAAGNSSGMPMDRGRIVAGLLQGIGFIGAGTIINVGSIQRGLTTAAMIWLVAVLGIAVGLGDYLIAVSATAFALSAVLLLEPLGQWLSGSAEFSLHLQLAGGAERVRRVEAFIEKNGYRVNTSRLTLREAGDVVDTHFVIGTPRGSTAEDLIELLNNSYPDIRELTVER